MSDDERIRLQLLALREQLQGLSSDSSDARATVTLDQASVGRLSRMDALQQQAMAAATEARRQQQLRAVAAALKRLEHGDYGYCEACGESIAAARLALDPTHRYCVDCADQQDVNS